MKEQLRRIGWLMRVAQPAMRVVRTFNHVVFTALSFVVPKDDHLLLFGGPWDGNKKAVYEFCERQRKAYRLSWTTPFDSRDWVPALEDVYVPRRSWRALWLTLRARFLFIDYQAAELSDYPLFGRFSIVQLWHGSPLKKILLDSREFYDNRTRSELYMLRKEFQNYALVAATSETTARTMQSAFLVVDPARIKVVGLPRNDQLFAPVGPKPAELQGFKRVLLYAPTFRDSGRAPTFLFEPDELSRLAAALEKQQTLLLIKPHRLELALYERIPSEHRFIRNVVQADFDVVEMFPQVDVLITDYSSVMFDFGLTRKPIVFFAWDLEEYLARSREMYFDYLEVIPGPVARNVDELIRVLENLDTLVADPAYQRRYAEFVRLFHTHQDGHSTRRVLDELGIR